MTVELTLFALALVEAVLVALEITGTCMTTKRPRKGRSSKRRSHTKGAESRRASIRFILPALFHDVLFRCDPRAVCPRGKISDLDAQLFAGFTGRPSAPAITRACKLTGTPHFSPHGLRKRRGSLLDKQDCSLTGDSRVPLRHEGRDGRALPVRARRLHRGQLRRHAQVRVYRAGTAPGRLRRCLRMNRLAQPCGSGSAANTWIPQRDSNPRYRRERPAS